VMPVRRDVAVGEFVQVGAFGGAQAQCPSQGVEDLPGRVHVAALLEERVVGGGDRRELSDLFPAQALGAASGAGGQPDIGRPQSPRRDRSRSASSRARLPAASAEGAGAAAGWSTAVIVALPIPAIAGYGYHPKPGLASVLWR